VPSRIGLATDRPTIWHIFCVISPGWAWTSRLETEIAMKRIFSGLALTLIPALIAMPALAAVDMVPAPAIGLALPAIAAVILVALIAFLLKQIKI